MKLTRIIPLLLSCGALIVTATACEDMLDTTSNGYVFDDDHNLDSANDSLYSAMGILTQMQALGERYVMLGELRGDLAEVPATARVDYQNLSLFEPVGEESPLLSRRDYYSVINNCNVALARMDTTITEHGSQVMLPEYAAIRTMRDWTMLQIALAYGEVSYMDRPLLSVDDTAREFATVSLDDLVPRLIADLEPFAARNTPDYGSVDGLQAAKFFMSPALLLADLCLYDGRYEQAARMYYKVIDDAGYTINIDHANTWTTSVRAEAVKGHIETYSNEAVVILPYASDAKKYHPDMVNITYNTKPGMVPAEWWVNDMNAATHFHIDRLGITNISGYLEGDLRGMFTDREGNTISSAFGYEPTNKVSTPLVMKYLTNGTSYSSVSNPGNPLLAETSAVLTRSIALARNPHLYLRYAEAVNRAGKPTLAFAVLKYGLRAEILDDETKVDPAELADGVEWTNFADQKYNSNYGTAMRGRGLGIGIEQTSYVIPEGLDKDAVTEWVEERILEEMAAETAFEGNRFFDLLRISRHRADHPVFMARQIARRFDNPARIEAKLADISNVWVR